jgi:hypothetical protein
MRYVRSTGDTNAESIGHETGIPAYIVNRYQDAIARGQKQWMEAKLLQEREAQP